MKKWGIKKRILLMTLTPSVILALALGTFFTHTRIQDTQAIFLDRGLSISRQLATACEYGVFTANRTLLLGLANATLEEPDIRSITIYDRFQRPLIHSGPRPQLTEDAQLFGKREAYFEQPGMTRFVAPIHLQEIMVDDLLDLNESPLPGVTLDQEGQTILGWVVLELSTANNTLLIYQTLFLSAGLIGAGLIVLLLIALRLSKDVSDPILETSKAVTAIREGKLDTRVYTRSNKEMQALEFGINSLAESLSKAYDEMQQNVDQATEDLRETLETIEIQNIELDIARKEALEASRVKSEFLANMSHEIRTPLNGIIGFTKILKKGPMTPQQTDHLDTIQKSSEILLTIINDILDFSKIEAGKLILDSTPIKLREVIEEVMTMLAPAAHQKNLDLVSLFYSDVPANIMGDPLRLKQIITNLINNAIKFTQSGEVVLRTMLEDQKENQFTLKFSVADTGVGLSRIQQQTIFNAFSQADASTARQFGGTGLGLVISKRLVEEMGGKMGLESELGKGSTFWFSLDTEAAPPSELDVLPNLEGHRVLYLETQSTTRLAVEHMLDQLGLDVKSLDDVERVEETVIEAQRRGEGFSAILLGINRHQIKSNILRKLVHTLEFDRDCRTLLLTPTLDSNEELLIDSVSLHLTKPISFRRLTLGLSQLILGVAPPEAIAQLAPPSRPDTRSSNLYPTVLAVDDNDANLKLIVNLLEGMGATTLAASSGFEALSKFRSQPVDLVFMDVQMPGMDGIETTRQIRQLESNSGHTPIVALTAHALSEEKTTLLKSGFDDYLTKPIDENQIQQIILKRTGHQLVIPETEMPQLEQRIIRPSAKRIQAPCVDISASIKLAAGKIDLAEELFSMLLEHLVEDQEEIKRLAEAEDYAKLNETVHKLHGATRYCGVPELRLLTEQLETSLKRQTPDIESLVDQVLVAIRRVLEWSEHQDWPRRFREHLPPGDHSTTANATT